MNELSSAPELRRAFLPLQRTTTVPKLRIRTLSFLGLARGIGGLEWPDERQSRRTPITTRGERLKANPPQRVLKPCGTRPAEAALRRTICPEPKYPQHCQAGSVSHNLRKS